MGNNIEKIIADKLEEFAELTSHVSIVYRKATTKDRNKKERIYFSHNQVATCLIRTRETVKYINSLELKKENQFGQAFNFYEFVNCCSIVFECINSLFDIFNKDLKEIYGKEKVFKKSNKARANDIKFFKFIRSACAVHPENTTGHNKITKLKHEFYPYAVWKADSRFYSLKNIPEDCDIILMSWNSMPDCHNKAYYLYIEEIYDFINKIISCIKDLIVVAQDIILKNKEKRNCKRLKDESQFANKSDYCIYLRNRLLKKKHTSEEFRDGGLLIASHILSNDILNIKFKESIFNNVKQIAKQMLVDVEDIGFDDIYKEWDLYRGINELNANNSHYICEKFSYLEQKAKREIESNKFGNVWEVLKPDASHINKYEYASYMLLTQVENFYNIKDLKNVKSFTDLFEITLQTVLFKLKRK